MIKFYCDKCGREIEVKPKRAQIEFRPSIVSFKLESTHDFCDDCYSKIKIYALSKEEAPSD